MRKLIREQPHEQPLVAGQYQYRRDDQPTGSYERWRFSAAADGYHYLRVDLNAEAGEGADSTLYHLTLNPAGRPERLSFRHFRRGSTLAGTLLFEPQMVTFTQTVAGRRLEEEVAAPAGHLFWFPATVALGPPAHHAPAGDHPALILRKGETFTLQPVTVSLHDRPVEQIEVMGSARQTRPVIVKWDESNRQRQERAVWLDEAGWPLRMVRGDGLVALEIRYMRYRVNSK